MYAVLIYNIYIDFPHRRIFSNKSNQVISFHELTKKMARNPHNVVLCVSLIYVVKIVHFMDTFLFQL